MLPDLFAFKWFACAPQLIPYIQKVIAGGPPIHASAIIKLFQRTQQNGARCQPPSHLEIEVGHTVHMRYLRLCCSALPGIMSNMTVTLQQSFFYVKILHTWTFWMTLWHIVPVCPTGHSSEEASGAPGDLHGWYGPEHNGGCCMYSRWALTQTLWTHQSQKYIWLLPLHHHVQQGDDFLVTCFWHAINVDKIITFCRLPALVLQLDEKLNQMQCSWQTVNLR